MDQIFLQNLYCWFFSKHVGHAGSAANKGRSSVNYRQSLTFGGLYLSCNDHCDRWFFQEIFFYYYFQKQPYADILQNRCCKKFCNIYRKASVLEFLFNKVCRPFNLVPKETSTQVTSTEWKLRHFYEPVLFLEHLWWLLLSIW